MNEGRDVWSGGNLSEKGAQVNKSLRRGLDLHKGFELFPKVVKPCEADEDLAAIEKAQEYVDEERRLRRVGGPFASGETVEKAWNGGKINPKEVGKYEGWTLSELRSAYNDLKKKGPHKKGSSDLGRLRELSFAIRAKTGWGKVKKEDGELDESEEYLLDAACDAEKVRGEEPPAPFADEPLDKADWASEKHPRVGAGREGGGQFAPKGGGGKPKIVAGDPSVDPEAETEKPEHGKGLSEGDKNTIEWIVNRLHVGMSDAEVEAMMKKRWGGKVPEHMLSEAVDFALKVHAENRKTYRDVMGSGSPKPAPAKAPAKKPPAESEGKGSGMGPFKKGAEIKSAKDLKVGDILVNENEQFGTVNVARVTGFSSVTPESLFRAVFVDPKDPSKRRLPDDREFSIHDFELNRDHFFRAESGEKPAKAPAKEPSKEPPKGETTSSGHRPLHQIAREIRRAWGSKVNFAAKPYLEALASLEDIKDKYGMDDAKSIVAYFLSNAASFKGEDAKRLKAELKGILKKTGYEYADFGDDLVDDVKKAMDEITRPFVGSLVASVQAAGHISKAQSEMIMKESGWDKLPIPDKAKEALEGLIGTGAKPVTEYTGKLMIEHGIAEEPPAFVRPKKLEVGDMVIPLDWRSVCLHGAKFDMPQVPKAARVKKIYMGPAKVSKNPYPFGRMPSDISKVETVTEDRMWGIDLEGDEVGKDDDTFPSTYPTRDTTMVLRMEALASPEGEVNPGIAAPR